MHSLRTPSERKYNFSSWAFQKYGSWSFHFLLIRWMICLIFLSRLYPVVICSWNLGSTETDTSAVLRSPELSWASPSNPESSLENNKTDPSASSLVLIFSERSISKEADSVTSPVSGSCKPTVNWRLLTNTRQRVSYIFLSWSVNQSYIKIRQEFHPPSLSLCQVILGLKVGNSKIVRDQLKRAKQVQLPHSQCMNRCKCFSLHDRIPALLWPWTSARKCNGMPFTVIILL